MAVTTEVASIRVPKGTVSRLKMLAHKKSLDEGTDISWCEVVRKILAENIFKQEDGNSARKCRSNHLANNQNVSKR